MLNRLAAADNTNPPRRGGADSGRLPSILSRNCRALSAQVKRSEYARGGLARDRERLHAGRAQILVEHARRRLADDVDRPGTGKAATGRPLASASISTMPNVSVRDGKTKTSALA